MPSETKTAPTMSRIRITTAGASVLITFRYTGMMRSPLLRRCELSEVINAELVLQTRHLVHHLFKAIFAKQLMLLVLELLTQRVIFIGCDNLTKRGEQDRVLARGMRPIHPNELPQRLVQLPSVFRILERSRRRQTLNLICDPPACLVLLSEHCDEIGEFPGLLKPREQIIFLEFFVVVLDEGPYNLSRAGKHRGVKLLLGIQTPQPFLINKKNTVQHAMLAHQVFRRRDLFFGFAGRTTALRGLGGIRL